MTSRLPNRRHSIGSLFNRRPVVAVFVGGLVGSGIRVATGLAIPTPVGGWPWATALVNVTGALALGWLVARRLVAPSEPWVVSFWGIGVLGSFTTFSAFAVEVGRLASDRSGLAAVAYAALSVGAGLVAAGVGLAIGRGRP